MIMTVENLIEKLSGLNSDMQVRILDLMDDTGESGIYEIKSVEVNIIRAMKDIIIKILKKHSRICNSYKVGNSGLDLHESKFEDVADEIIGALADLTPETRNCNLSDVRKPVCLHQLKYLHSNDTREYCPDCGHFL